VTQFDGSSIEALAAEMQNVPTADLRRMLAQANVVIANPADKRRELALLERKFVGKDSLGAAATGARRLLVAELKRRGLRP
jgi:hypothetical protein